MINNEDCNDSKNIEKILNPKSFRFNENDINKINTMYKEVNLISCNKISKTKIMQAIVHMGFKINPAEILHILGEII